MGKLWPNVKSSVEIIQSQMPTKESHTEPSSILTTAPGNSWSLWSECQQNFDFTEYEKHNWRETVVCLFYSHLKKCINSKEFSYSLLKVNKKGNASVLLGCISHRHQLLTSLKSYHFLLQIYKGCCEARYRQDIISVLIITFKKYISCWKSKFDSGLTVW